MTFTEEKSENKENVQKKKFDIYSALSDLGEYFTSVIIRLAKFIGLCFMYLVATVYRGLEHLKKPFMNLISEIANVVTAPFKRYHKARKLGTSEIAKARQEKGAWGGFTAWLKVAGRTVFGKRGVLATLVNWGLPVVCCVFFST